MVAGARGLLCLVLVCHSASVQSFLFSIPSSAFPLWRTSSRSASAAARVQRPQDVPALRRSRMPTGSIYGNKFSVTYVRVRCCWAHALRLAGRGKRAFA
jgi:hypothetical protein